MFVAETESGILVWCFHQHRYWWNSHRKCK